MSELHQRRLEAMYLAAPVNRIYEPSIHIESGAATIAVDVKPELFHSTARVAAPAPSFAPHDDGRQSAALGSLGRQVGAVVTYDLGCHCDHPCGEVLERLNRADC